MTKIENEMQYRWALQRVEELLPLVNDDTPLTDPHSIELDLLSGMVADYSDQHFSIGTPSLIDVIKLRMYEMGQTRGISGGCGRCGGSRRALRALWVSP